MSQSGKFSLGTGAAPIETLTGNAGGAVGPDGVGNVDVLGAGEITVTGNPGANTATISIVNGANGQLLIGGGAAAAWSTLASAGGTITITNAANSINLETGAAIATSFDGDVGTAVPALGVLTVAGGTNINTVGAASTITINLDTAITGIVSLDFAAGGRIGTATGAGNTLLLQAYDVDGAVYTTFGTLTANNTPTMDLSDSVTKAGQYIYRAGGTDVPVTDGGTGASTLANNAVLVGSGVGAITALAVGADGQLVIGRTGADPLVANLASAGATIAITNGPGTINLETGAAVATQFNTDVGNAVPAAGVLIVAGGTNINTAGAGNTVTVNLDAAVAGLTSLDFAAGGRLGTALLAGNTALLQAYDVDGAAYVTFATLTANNTPTMDLEDTVTKAGQYIYRAAGTDVPVTDGGTGASTLTDHGVLVGSGATAITPLAVAGNGELVIGSVGADPAIAIPISTDATINITGGAGTLDIELADDPHATAISSWHGSLLETSAVTVTSDGATITLGIQKSGGGNLTANFSDGFYAWTTAPDTVTLTAGADIAPTLNYTYLLQSTKTLTNSAVSWPATEHVPIATTLCQSAASLAGDGAYKVHVWTDHTNNSNNQGHIYDLNRWIRHQDATWMSGVAQTLTITPNGGAADNVIFTSTAGVVMQLHHHTFPAFAGTPDVYTVNDFTTPYNIVTDLNALLTDSANGSMSGKYFTLVIWGVQSESTGDCKLMINLPGGSYNTAAGQQADDSNFTNYSIPGDFRGTGFLIYEMQLRHQVAASGTWTSIRNIDLRGEFPSRAAGGSTSFTTEFADNVFRIFDDGDVSKELAFQVDQVTTATTRTITMDDRDIDLDAVPDSFATDGAAATPAAGIVTIAGGTNITSAGAGSTVTVNLDAAISGITSLDLATTGRIGTALLAGNTALLQAYDVDGAAYVTFATLTANNTPTMDLDDAVTKANNYIYRVGGTDVSVADGGTGLSTITDHGVMVGSGAGNVTPLAVGTDGQCLLGSTGADPVFATLASAGGTITFTPGAGTLNLEAAAGMTWTEVVGAAQAMAVNNGYILNNAGLVTATLPAVAVVGDIVAVVGKGAGGWLIAQNAGQTIHFIGTDTTAGAGGSLASTVIYDCVELICMTANTDWVARTSMGNITIV